MSPGHGRATIDKTRSPDRVEPGGCHKTPTLPLRLVWHSPLAILSLTQWQPGMSWTHCRKGQASCPYTPCGPLQCLASPEIRVDGIYRCGEHHGIPLSILGIFRILTAGGAGHGGRQKVQTHKVLHFLRSLQQPMASLTPLEPEYISRALVLEVGLRSLAHPHRPEPEPT